MKRIAICKKTIGALLITLLQTAFADAQEITIRKLSATKINSTIKLDGVLSEAAWKSATPIDSFTQRRPVVAGLENPANKTEMYILYDDNFVYVGGYFHEANADSISKELVGRDVLGANDYAAIIIDTYNDKINASGFFVTPLGEQYDAKYSQSTQEDGNWNAVWDSEAKLQKDGWTFEMRIPYSALRFSNRPVQNWGINLFRRRSKASQQLVWNRIDPEINGFVNQEGEWTGIENLRPPLRLSFSPFISAYVNHYPDKTPGVDDVTSSFNGGMDLKYGINESLTLDMTLVPDFGQVQSDNQVLNLTPFEVKFNENRAFFTEGTELFNKGDLFYSRRIGGQPLHLYDVYNNIGASERIIKNPAETKLINAAKISGRNKKGLGIGIFNAITKPMYASIEDNNNNSRKIETNPLTNYNIIVLDQSLKNNSYVSFINTNVMRSGKDYDANVSAGVFDFNNKKNTYNWSGKIAISNLLNVAGKNITGYMHNLSFGKTGGRFNYRLTQELTDDKYDHNDLGILFNNNYFDHYLFVGYKWLTPGKWYNNLYLNLNTTYSNRFKAWDYQTFNSTIDINGQLKNLSNAGFSFMYEAANNDFYESHVPDRVFKRSGSIQFNAWYDRNEAKKYVYGGNVAVRLVEMFNSKRYLAYIYNRYRFNSIFSLGYEVSVHPVFNEAGFANPAYIGGFDTAFSRRNVNTIENVLTAKLSFSKNAGVTLRVRHYWSKVETKEFLTLNQDGTLSENNSFNKNVNQNFNAFNVDMVYTWQFAPGSFFNLVWKNAIYSFDQNVDRSYGKNLDDVLASPQNNNLSLKVIYYLDYARMRKKGAA